MAGTFDYIWSKVPAKSPESPLSWLAEHGKTVFGLLAAVASGVFGTAHWFFYRELGVQPGDVGLGPAEILSQAVLGVLAVAGVFLVMAASAALVFWRARDTALLSNLRARLPMRPTVGWASAIFIVLLVGFTVAAVVAGVAHVRAGEPVEGLAYPLAGGPVRCVDVVWTGTPKPDGVPGRAMHLGEAGGRVVLYVPGRGPVRLPAGDVIVLSTEDQFACRLP